MDQNGKAKYLDKGQRVDLVLACDLNASRFALLHIVARSDSGFDSRIDLVVVEHVQDSQVVCARGRNRVHARLVSQTKAMSCQSRLLNVVGSLSAGEETFVRDDGVDSSGHVAGRGGVVTKHTTVQNALLEVEVDFLAFVEALLGREVADNLGFHAIGNEVVELDFARNEASGSIGKGRGGA